MAAFHWILLRQKEKKMYKIKGHFEIKHVTIILTVSKSWHPKFDKVFEVFASFFITVSALLKSGV